MFSKLFGKKKDNFYLELKEDQNGSAPKPEAVAKPVEVTPPPAPAKQEPAPVVTQEAKKSKKTSVKKDKKAPVATETSAPAETPKTVAPATNGKVEPAEVEFATKYAITPTLSRRRPGPSLNVFKDMAKQAKVPNK